MKASEGPAGTAAADKICQRQAAQDVESAIAALLALFEGDYDIGFASGSLAGLETAVVVAETPGGIVPLFAYINRDLASVLRDHRGELPEPVDGSPRFQTS